MSLFRSELSAEERSRFDAVAAAYEGDNLAHDLTLPPSDNPTYVANNKTQDNDARWLTWQEEARPRLVGTAEKWRKVDLRFRVTDEELLAGIREMGIEEGIYWTGNTSHTFGIAKSTDDQLQCFLHENLPEDHYISGQFLTGFESKTLRGQRDPVRDCEAHSGERGAHLPRHRDAARSSCQHDVAGTRRRGLNPRGARRLFRRLRPPGVQPGLHRADPSRGPVGDGRDTQIHGAERETTIPRIRRSGPRRFARPKFAEVSKKLSGTHLLAVPLPSLVRSPIQPHPRRDRVLFRLHLVRAAADGLRAGSASWSTRGRSSTRKTRSSW